jgi:hypothetical protein
LGEPESKKPSIDAIAERSPALPAGRGCRAEVLLPDIFAGQQVVFALLPHETISLLSKPAFGAEQFGVKVFIDYDMGSHKSDSNQSVHYLQTIKQIPPILPLQREDSTSLKMRG